MKINIYDSDSRDSWTDTIMRYADIGHKVSVKKLENKANKKISKSLIESYFE